MGRIGKLISFVRATVGTTKTSDVKVDRGGGDNRTPQHFSAPGDDSFPLPGDFVAIVDQAGTGRDSAVGYVDPKNLQKATAGDKRIYARDANGDQIIELWLKNDGTATLSNANGSFTLAPDGSITGTNANGSYQLQAGGDFVVNGVTIDTAGNITTPTTLSAVTVVASGSMTAAGKELAGHDHPINSGSSAPGPTGPNN